MVVARRHRRARDAWPRGRGRTTAPRLVGELARTRSAWSARWSSRTASRSARSTSPACEEGAQDTGLRRIPAAAAICRAAGSSGPTGPTRCSTGGYVPCGRHGGEFARSPGDPAERRRGAADVDEAVTPLVSGCCADSTARRRRRPATRVSSRQPVRPEIAPCRRPPSAIQADRGAAPARDRRQPRRPGAERDPAVGACAHPRGTSAPVVHSAAQALDAVRDAYAKAACSRDRHFIDDMRRATPKPTSCSPARRDHRD